jgi:hypothetical protein
MAAVWGALGAELINVDFGAGPATEMVGPAATGESPTDFWNYYERRFLGGNYVGSGIVRNLRLADGTATSAWMSVANAEGAWGNGVPDPMYSGYLYPFNADPIVVTFWDLPVGTYQAYLYGHGGPGVDAANSVFEVLVGGVSQGSKATTTGPGWATIVWKEGDQYVRFTEVVVESGNEVVIRVSKGGYNEGYLAGVQLVRGSPVAGVPLSIRPNGGSFTNSVSVSLVSGVPGAEVRYTTDGSDPVLQSTRYQAAFELTRTTTVKARLFVNGFPASEIASAEFVADPGLRLTPPGGLFTNRVEVAIASRIPGTTLHYTLDGSEPGAASPVYSDPIRLTTATTVRARAYLNGFPVTEVITGVYQRVYAFDDDGVGRDWRVRYFGEEYPTDPRAGADADPDGDGTSNRQEYTAGTDPLDPLSGFAVGVRAVPEIRFASKVGSLYRILRRSAVDGASVVVAEIRATAEQTTWVDQEAGVVVDPAFYVVQPVP